MATNIKDVIKNIDTIYSSDSSINALLDFERVLSELDLYAFRNWKSGELVEGPISEKYFVSCTFMWPAKLMPDPRGGERLLGYDCEVSYKKSKLEYIVDVKSQDDFETGTRVPKKKAADVWLVTIIMPKSLIEEIHQGALELEHSSIDIEEVEQAYADGDDESDELASDNEFDVPEELPK